jgi:hypothetical protein
LDELMPEYLPAVPRDRFDGRPLKYRMTNGWPTLYSVGEDRGDHGGNSMDGSPGSEQKPGDWILWPVIEDEPLVRSSANDTAFSGDVAMPFAKPPEPSDDVQGDEGAIEPADVLVEPCR